ncbi:MAG: cysteine hydrolase [Chloroflexi bacterium]|nr:cysteine hydrolase [Chloroflexota bacterium]
MKLTEIDPKTTALIVHKLQNDWAWFKPDTLAKQLERNNTIPKVASLIAAARRAGMPVIWVAHIKRPDMMEVFVPDSDAPDTVRFLIEGTPGAEFMDGIKPGPTDHLVISNRYSTFYNTDYDIRLRCLGVRTLIVVGVLINCSVFYTTADALDRDYNTIIVSDCVASNSEEINEFFLTKQFPIMSRVRAAEEVLAGIANAQAQIS